MFTNSFGLVVCGSRGIADYQLFVSKLDHLLSKQELPIHIITSDSEGVAEMARRYAEKRGFKLHVFYTMWHEHGKTAIINRNQSMFKFLLDNFEHRGCFAMWDGQSIGTERAIGIAKYSKVAVRICIPKHERSQAVPKSEPVFVSAPKWFQDDPNISNYDKFLLRHHYENLPKNRDPRDEARDRTVYIEETPRQKQKRRERLLARAARLADLMGIWADEPEELPSYLTRTSVSLI